MRLKGASSRARLIQSRGIGTAPRKHVASFIIGVVKSLNGVRLCDIGDDAEMCEYGGKRRHCVTGKFFGNSIIDSIEQHLLPALRPFPSDPLWLHVSLRVLLR